MAPPTNDTELQDSAHSKTSPVVWLGGVAAACTALITVLATIEGVPSVVVAVLGGIAAVATAIGGYITKSQVTPWKDVVSKVTPTGNVVSGPADTQNSTGALVEFPQAA